MYLVGYSWVLIQFIQLRTLWDSEELSTNLSQFSLSFALYLFLEFSIFLVCNLSCYHPLNAEIRIRTARHWLSDPKNRQVVRSADIVFNEKNMQMITECPIELRRVTFADATPTDGPTMHTRAALWSVACTATSTWASTSTYLDPAGQDSNDTATMATPVPTNRLVQS